MSMKKISKNLLAILIGITLSFVLLEGLLRVFEPIEYRVKGNKIKLPRDKKYQFSNDKTDKLDRVIFSTTQPYGVPGRNAAARLSQGPDHRCHWRQYNRVRLDFRRQNLV